MRAHCVHTAHVDAGILTVQYGYITPAFLGSPWRGEFNMGDEKWVKIVENGQNCVTFQVWDIPNAWEDEKKNSLEPKTCQKGPRVGADYSPTSKTSHCVHGTPLEGGWASKGQVWTRHLAPAAPAARPSSPSQFHVCPVHQCTVPFGSLRVLSLLIRDKPSWF